MSLLDRVRATLRRHDLVTSDSRVLVAVSGGPDSVALARLLQALEGTHDLRVAGLAHFDHGLRAESAEDVGFCRELAAALGVPIVVAAENIRERARRDHQSIETAAHAARYEFLARAAADLSADRIALGHSRDDQAETLLLRLLRGAGLRGLGGMHPKHGPYIRPLIDCRRADLRAHLDGLGQAYLTDATNDDTSVPRNRIRAELMPLLERRFNPRIVDVLAAEADLAREAWQWTEDEAHTLIEASLVQRGADAWVLEAEALSRAPVAVARAALLCALEQMAQGRSIQLRHVAVALDLVRSPGGAADLPGQRVQRIGPQLVLRRRTAGRGHEADRKSSPNFFRYPLSIPGEAPVPVARCTIVAEAHLSGADVAGLCRDRLTTVIPLERVNGQLAVRNRRSGDRFRPLGLNGHKKLQDFFVDRKVPSGWRDHVPLVVDQDDQIVWVAGHVLSEDFRVTSATQAVIILRLSLWGGAA